MAEFAEVLGTQQSTISRYESGQLVPSKSVLILLFLIARAREREALAKAIGSTVNRLRSEEGQSRTTGREEFSGADPVIRDFVNLLHDNPENDALKDALRSMLPYFRFCARS